MKNMAYPSNLIILASMTYELKLPDRPTNRQTDMHIHIYKRRHNVQVMLYFTFIYHLSTSSCISLKHKREN